MTKELVLRCDGPNCKSEIPEGFALFYKWQYQWLHIKLTQYYVCGAFNTEQEYDLCSQACLKNLLDSWKDKDQ